MWTLYAIEILVSVEIAVSIHLRINYGCFHVTTAELSSCDRLYGMQTLKYLLAGSLPKRFVDFWSKAMSRWPQML